MFKKVFSFVCCLVTLVSFNTVVANGYASQVTEDTCIYGGFNSGYKKYPDTMEYNVCVNNHDCEINVYANCVKAHSPEELDGDYIKFGTVIWDDSQLNLFFYPFFDNYDIESGYYDEYYNGDYYTIDKTFNGVHTTEFWCKHASFGIAQKDAFNFRLSPIVDVEDVDTSVTIFGEVFHLVGSTDNYDEVDEFAPTPETAPLGFYNYDTATTVVETTMPVSITESIPDKISLGFVTQPSTETTADIAIKKETSTSTVVSDNSSVSTVVSDVGSIEGIIDADKQSPVPPMLPVDEEETTTMFTTVNESEETTTTSTVVEETGDSTSSEETYSVFDINKDGYINFSDVIALLNFIVSK